ncbi:MAG: hypothetical protein OXL36_21760 [Bryobacterales bacterium]|nr:hypothetical protein [Bryobacterales bacterium]MDE0292921.1 hypothetical protein [Bryobacterales bacterium]
MSLSAPVSRTRTKAQLRNGSEIDRSQVLSGHEIIESTVESLDSEERALLMERIEAV